MKTIMKPFLMMALIGSISLFGINISFAQNSLCLQRTKMVKTLTNKYKERQVVIGLTKNGNLIEIFASKTGTWTLMLTRPDESTCLLAAGESFNIITEEDFDKIGIEY